MKKVALSLIALLSFGSFASAEDVALEKNATVSATVAASATVKYGIDLSTKTSGFSHSEDFKVEVKILDGKDSKTGTGDVYGSIELADLAFKGDLEDGTDSSPWAFGLGDITAKINFPNGYVKTNENTDPSVGYGVDGDDDNGGATIVNDDTFYTYKNRYGKDSTEWTIGGTIPGFSAFDGNGIEAGYTVPGVVAVTATVGSKGDLESNTGNRYEGALELGLKAVDKLTLAVKGYAGAGDRDALVKGLGATAGYDLGLLVPYFNLNTVGAFASSSSAVQPIYVLATDPVTGLPILKASNPDDIKAAKYAWDDDGAYSADLGTKVNLDGLTGNVALTYASDSKLNAVVTLNLAADKLAGPVSALAGVRLFNLTSAVEKDSTKTTEVFGKVSAKVDTITVWGAGSFNASGAEKSSSIFAKLGVDVAAFSLTTLGAEWDSSDLGEAKQSGDQTLGQAFVYAKVAY